MLSGYSFKSSQYGLAIDNVVGYELVLPNGTAINVTSKDDDLWFGLRVSMIRMKSRYVIDSLTNRREGSITSYVRYQFSARAILMGCWPLIGNRDQVHSQVSPPRRHMGKLTRMIHSEQPTENIAGRHSSLCREPTRCN